MRFFVPINDPSEEENGSQTVHIVDTGSSNPRTNKRKLREYFLAVGVPENKVKKVMKAMGFWGEALRGSE